MISERTPAIRQRSGTSPVTSQEQFRSPFLGTFAKVRKETTGFVTAVRPHGATRFPLNGFSLNFTLGTFIKICTENSCWVTFGQKYQARYMRTQVEYVVLTAFPRQQWLRERASMLCLYVHCLSCYYCHCSHYHYH
jgi:hypothetical protein